MSFIKKIKNIFKKKELKKNRKKQQKNYDEGKTINNYHYHTYNTNIIPPISGTTGSPIDTIGAGGNYIIQPPTPQIQNNQQKQQQQQQQQQYNHSFSPLPIVPQQTQESQSLKQLQEQAETKGNLYHTLYEQPISLEKQNQSIDYYGYNNINNKNPKNKILPNTFSPASLPGIPATTATTNTTTTTTISPRVSTPKETNSPSIEDQMEEYKKLHRDKYKSAKERSTIISNNYNYNTTTTTTTTSSTIVNKNLPTISNNNNSNNPTTQRLTQYSPLKTSSNLLKRSSHKLRMNKSEYQRLYFSSRDGALWINDLPLKIKGISWFGAETSSMCVHGLWSRDYKQHLDFLKENAFNAVRIPFSYEMIVKDPFPTSININQQMNKDLYGLRALSVLDLVIEAAGERGLLILLDFHSFGPDDRLNDGLWYNKKYSEADVMKMWNILILRYGQTWNVMGVDLKNEPFSATWNSNNEKTDWDKAINRLGSYIQNNGGNQWLIFGQGIPSSHHNPERIACWGESFENEGLNGGQTTISLPLNDKFVYSPHCYGPSVVNHAHFNHRDFPHNLKPHWDNNFGNLPSNTGRGMVIGEWGGKYITPLDQLWMDSFVDYLLLKGCTDSFFWCLNPNSGDTGGIYLDDWVSINQPKLNLLNKLCPHPTKIKLDKDTMIYKISSVVTTQEA